jgi:hypothetical protein
VVLEKKCMGGQTDIASCVFIWLKNPGMQPKYLSLHAPVMIPKPIKAV